MLIPRNSAQQIVERMEAIIHRNINMMDAEGYIIASTDQDRIGKFHEAANVILKDHLSEFIVHDWDNMEGTREGINLPITIHDEIIGVIGITGKPEEIKDYSNIIKHMTEVLVLESYNNNQKERQDHNRHCFIEEWIFNSPKEIDSTFEMRGKLLGIDVKKAKVIAVLQADISDETVGEEDRQQIRTRLLGDFSSRITSSEKGVGICVGSKLTIISDITDYNIAKRKLNEIKKRLEDKYSVSLCGGVSSVQDNYLHLFPSYKQAVMACEISKQTEEKLIYSYDELPLELLMSQLPAESKKEFANRVFAGCRDLDIPKWLNTLNAFYKYNGSIGKASDELFIHKNTLQYRLNRITQETGYDPRNTRDTLILYLAIKFYPHI